MIETRQLAHAHDGGALIRFPDLRLPAGRTLLVRGNSGCGKSTWLALACGLLTPTAGDIRVGGVSPAALSAGVRDRWRGQRVGFLPQRLHLSDALTVAQNLELPYVALGLKVDQAGVAEVLERLGLTALAARRPSQLSGGQAQRVALARAVLRQPSLLLADEPTASLDDAACAQVLQLLADTAGAVGATLVLATHDRRVEAAWPQALTLRLDAHAGPGDAHTERGA